MNIAGIRGISTEVQQGVQAGRKVEATMQMDSISKGIQSQIANAQKKLQELSENKDMSLEEKMKRRQEIQQEITSLNQQLRQHQIEQRKERQQKAASEEDDKSRKNGNQNKTPKGNYGMSQEAMTAIISADSSMKQAKAQGSIASRMEGRTRVLESEIKADKVRGGNTEAKEAELADLQERVQKTADSQISTLAGAGKSMKAAAKADGREGTVEKKEEKEEKERAEAEKGKSVGNRVDIRL